MEISKFAVALAGAALLFTLPACRKADEADTRVAAETNVINGDLAGAIGELDNVGTARSLLDFAGFDEILSGPAPYTIFLPDDTAFEGLGEEKLAFLKTEEGRPELIALLRTHIAPGTLIREDIKSAIASMGGPITVANVGGSDMKIGGSGDSLILGISGGPQLMPQSVRAGNGVIYVIDAIIPPSGS